MNSRMGKFSGNSYPLSHWFDSRCFSLKLIYLFIFIFFRLINTNLGNLSLQPSGHACGVSLQYFSCSASENLRIPFLQYWQSTFLFGQVVRCLLSCPRRWVEKHPLGQARTRNGHSLKCFSFCSCWPVQVQPSLVQLILILPIRPSTIMLVPSRCPAKLVWHTWQVSFVD